MTRANSVARVGIYFSDFFQVDKAILDAYGAFNVSLVNDLPLFIDPFLLVRNGGLPVNAVEHHVNVAVCPHTLPLFLQTQ